MRRIKFRARVKKTKKWVNTSPLEMWWYTFADEDETGNSRASIPKKSYQQQRDELEYFGESTGLKDKNGKEIYEGDIVKRIIGIGWVKSPAYRTEEHIRKVIFSHGSFSAGYMFENTRMSIPVLTEGEEIEVIGNIYENPELLL